LQLTYFENIGYHIIQINKAKRLSYNALTDGDALSRDAADENVAQT